jgi:hypothetical protein
MTSQSYPTTPGFRDYDSSAAAAALIAPYTTGLHSAVLSALSIGPKTAFELAEAVGKPFSTIQPRVSELLRKGSIRWSGFKRRSGRSQVMVKVWELQA